MALSDIVPINRKEEFLQAIADKSGAPSPVTRIEEFLKRISETPGLPAVTSDDNGDFLGVVDGEWSKAPAPSSLPPYTSADKGKVLTVGEAEPETVVVVPEQSGTLSAITYDLTSTAYGAILDGVNTSDLANEQSISFTGSFGQDTSTMTLYYLADSNVFVTALDETGDIIVFLAEVDGQNKWIFNSYDPSTVGLAYTISATASVPSVEPKWESGGIKVLKCYTGEIPRKTGGGEIDASVNIWRFAASIAGNDINTFRAAVVDHSEYEKLTADDSVVIVDFSNGDLFFPVAAPSVFGRNDLGTSVPIGPPSDYLFESGSWLEPKELGTITFAYFNPQIADIQSNSAVPVLIIDASAVVVEELST